MTDETNPLANPALRNCGNCGCSMELSNPNDVSSKQLACRFAPPIAVDKRVRLPDPGNPRRQVEAIQRSFMHAPTTPEAVCIGGWCPKGTPPGENWQLSAFIASLMAGGAANG